MRFIFILITLLFFAKNVNAEHTYSTSVIGFILTELFNGNKIGDYVVNQEVARIKHNGTVYLIDKVFSDSEEGLLYNHSFISDILGGVHLEVKEIAHREWVKDVLGNDAYETIDTMSTDSWMYGD